MLRSWGQEDVPQDPGMTDAGNLTLSEYVVFRVFPTVQ